jgi:hypothetical protein
VEDLEAKLKNFATVKSQLQAQLDAAKASILDEIAAKKKLQDQLKNK